MDDLSKKFWNLKLAFDNLEKKHEHRIKKLQQRLNYLESEESIRKLNQSILNIRIDLDQLFERQSIEERFNHCIKLFKKAGIKLNTSFDFQSLQRTGQWKTWKMDELPFSEFKYYLFYLLSLDGPIFDEKKQKNFYHPHSDQIWYFDGERDSAVLYGDFILRFNLLTGNKLNLSDVENIIDPPYGVKFKINENQLEWNFEFNRDWIDHNFISHFLELAKANGISKNGWNFYCISEGQGGIYCFLHQNQFKYLSQILNFKREINPL